ncbi:hypothetical protein [Kribbella sp. NPDC051718]|uniref:hypothetical protein n=1 Tax=Kribbella sp. NPDC051718 TaxID=3155168 RepID=UPI0034353AD7
MPDDYHGLYFTEQTIFHLVLGKEYEVYEMGMFNCGLIVLIIDSTGQPDWYPLDLFEVVVGAIPSDWIFAQRTGGPEGMTAVWGHSRLAGDQALDESLASHDEGAVAVFWNEIFESQNSRSAE